MEDRLTRQLEGAVDGIKEEVSEVKEDIERLKDFVEKNSSTNNFEFEEDMLEKVEEVSQNMKTLKVETEQKLCEQMVFVEGAKEACMEAMEEYLGREVVGAIVATLDRRLEQVTGGRRIVNICPSVS